MATIFDPSAHRFAITTNSTNPPVLERFWPRDIHARLLEDQGILPVVRSNTDPGLSRDIVWFDPNGVTNADAAAVQGTYWLCLDGATWTQNPSAAQWRAWLKTYLGAGGAASIVSFKSGVNTFFAPGVSQVPRGTIVVPKATYPDSSKLFGSGSLQAGNLAAWFEVVGYINPDYWGLSLTSKVPNDIGNIISITGAGEAWTIYYAG